MLSSLTFNQSMAFTLTGLRQILLSFPTGLGHLSLVDSTITNLPQAKYLGFLWSSTQSAKHGIEHKINKVIFTLGVSGCFLGYPNPLSER